MAVGSDGDLYGDGVNAAARVQEAAEPGQVVLSEDVWRQLRGRTEFQFESLGDRSLKGVGPIGLYLVALKEPATKRQPSSAVSETVQRLEERKAGIRSIAVLPFADLSPQHDQEYFSDGVAEEILNALNKVAGLRVPARTSCRQFRALWIRPFPATPHDRLSSKFPPNSQRSSTAPVSHSQPLEESSPSLQRQARR